MILAASVASSGSCDPVRCGRSDTSGKSVARFCLSVLGRRQQTDAPMPAPNAEFRKRSQCAACCPDGAREKICFRFRKIVSSFDSSRLMQRGVRVVTIRRGGLRWTCERRQTTGARADGEIVWSWPPGAETKSAMRRARGRWGQESRSPRRSRISRKPLAQGRPGCLGRTCGSYPVHFIRTGAMGAASSRPSLRPPDFRGL